jgi:hypothetical protein
VLMGHNLGMTGTERGRAGATRVMNHLLANGMPRQIRYLAAKRNNLMDMRSNYGKEEIMLRCTSIVAIGLAMRPYLLHISKAFF